MKFKSIGQRMLFGFTIVVILILIQGTYNLINMKGVNDRTANVVDRQLVFMKANNTISSNIANQILYARDYIWNGGKQDFKDKFNDYTTSSEAAEAIILEKSTLPDTAAFIDRGIAIRDKLNKEVFEAYDQGNQEAAIEAINVIEAEAREVMDIYEQMSADRDVDITKASTEIMEKGKFTTTTIIITTILVIIISIAVALITSRQISRGVQLVTTRMNLVAAGDLTNPALEATSEDEIGELIEATNEMSKNSRDLLNEIHIVSERVSSQSEELTQAASEVTSGSQQIAATMQELSSGAETQSDRANKLFEIMKGFSTTVAETNNNGTNIQMASDEVLEMTIEGSQLMALSTEQMSKIDKIVLNAVARVEGLDQQSQKISKLVGVIKDIADQTNLLALNAAIEAARAGEHGQGFSIVADEVRKLAVQVAVSVTDITDIVDSIQAETKNVTESLQEGYKQVEQGSTQIKTTGETFNKISSSLTNMATHIGSVSINLAEIANNSKDMNVSIQDIASISEQSAAGVEETAASTQQANSSMQEVAGTSAELAGLAEQLNELVRRFKI